MKKRVLLYFAMAVLIAMPQQLMADDIAINETNFPDKNFRNWVLAQDYGSDGILTDEEIANVGEIDVHEKQISDLTGIEYFTALGYLRCDQNQLSTLNISKNTALYFLNCSFNQLMSLDVSKNIELIYLWCHENQLTELNVSQNKKLWDFSCGDNQLTTLDVSTNTALTKLNCSGNQLTSLNLSNNIELQTLECWSNEFTTIDVSKNTKLEWLDCAYNGKLTSLDLSNNIALTYLHCALDKLTSLDLSKNTALSRLSFRSNDITSIDLSKNVALTWLDCSGNPLASLDVSKNTSLTELRCQDNMLTELNVSKNTSLTSLYCYYNRIMGPAMDALIGSLPETGGELYGIMLDWYEQNVITKSQVGDAKKRNWICRTPFGEEYEGSEPVAEGIAIDATTFPDENFRNWVLAQDYGQDGVLTEAEIAGVTEIYVSWQNITSLKGIEYFTALTELYCDGNQLTSLDMSQNTALTKLSCYYNQLTSLDVSKNTALTELSCYLNQLSTLDISKNTALTYLNCSGNQLTSLDVSQNTALTELSFEGNQLTSLDVSQNTALESIYCNYNQLTSLDVSQNMALTKLFCAGNQISETEMGNLVESLPTNNGELYVKDLTYANEQNVITPTQVAAAKAKGWTVYAFDENVGDYGDWVEYDGDEPQEITPVEQGETIDIGTEIDENTDLDGNVVGDVFYSISSGDGSYDPEEGCIVVTKPTDDSAIDGKDIFGEDFKAGYTGIVFKVNEGKGSIKVEAQTQGNMVLKVKIGDNDPIEMELEGKLKVSFPYNVSEETLVYIYGGTNAAGAKGIRKAASSDALKIYGIEVVSETNGIDNVQSSMFNVQSPIYNLNGQRVISSPSGRPGGVPTKGIYIKNGRKVLVK